MLKKLLGQTIIYGLSNVLVRVFPFILTPMLVRAFGPSKYAIYADFYSAAGIISVLLTHGMETTFFRYFQKYKDNTEVQKTIYATTLTSVIAVSSVFLFFGYIFRQPLADVFKHGDNVQFLVWFLLILVADAISAIPFAKLRIENNAMKFGGLKIFNSLLMFFMTLVLVFWIPNYIEKSNGETWLTKIYNPSYGIGYAFAANLIASIVTFALLVPTIFKQKFIVDTSLWKQMLKYSWPVTIAGLAGIVNETMDRQFIKYLLPEGIANVQLGIYSAVYKIATFVTLFKTAYLLGVEPFFFSHASHENSGKTYAKLMNYFAIFSCLILLFLVANLDWIGKLYINNPEYWSGLSVVPIILIGSTFLGIYLNLSVWYKLSDQTHYGALISLIGAAITIVLNYIGLKYTSLGYWACAWATLLSYLVMTIISYIWGQKNYRIPYNKKKLVLYLGLSCLISFVVYYGISSEHYILKPVIGNLFLGGFIYLLIKIEHEDYAMLKARIKPMLSKFI